MGPGSPAHRVAARVVGQHRRVHAGLSRLGAMVGEATRADAGRTTPAVRRAIGFLERDVMQHADVEDALVDRLCRPEVCTAAGRGLTTSHDTLREATATLRQRVDHDGGDGGAVGLLVGVHDLLRSHVDEEWTSVLPLLDQLDDSAAEEIEAGLALPPPDDATGQRLWVPVELARATAALDDLRAVAAATADRVATALHRAVTSTGPAAVGAAVPTLELVRLRTDDDRAMYAGRLRTDVAEQLVAPVDLACTLRAAEGGRTTVLEVHHTNVNRYPLADDAPARALTIVAVDAMIGELARHLRSHR